MTNQYSLQIRPMDVRRVVVDTLAVFHEADQGKQCFLTGVWYLPADWSFSLSPTLIAWAIMARDKSAMDPAIQVRGQRYAAPYSVAICVDSTTLLKELRDFAADPEVLEAEYDEPLMDRIIQPLQLIQNLRTEEPNLSAGYEQVEDTVARIYDNIREYGRDFCGPEA